MKKIATVFILLFLGFQVSAQTRLYENPNFEQIATSHHIIAILPFDTSITLRPKDMKETTPEELKKMEKDTGEDIQSSMFSWFLQRKEKGRLTVDILGIAQTNIKLKEAGITPEKLEEHTPKELANILGVDAVIMGSFETDKPMSDGASMALGLLTGFYGATDNAVINLFIYNGKDGEVLVNYHKGVSASFSNTDKLINKLMRKASRRIAYVK